MAALPELQHSQRPLAQVSIPCFTEPLIGVRWGLRWAQTSSPRCWRKASRRCPQSCSSSSHSASLSSTAAQKPSATPPTSDHAIDPAARSIRGARGLLVSNAWPLPTWHQSPPATQGLHPQPSPRDRGRRQWQRRRAVAVPVHQRGGVAVVARGAEQQPPGFAAVQ